MSLEISLKNKTEFGFDCYGLDKCGNKPPINFSVRVNLFKNLNKNTKTKGTLFTPLSFSFENYTTNNMDYVSPIPKYLIENIIKKYDEEKNGVNS
jgi:hypothetical protein